MYIAPNSTIKLLHGVPLDPTYEHSIYFSKYSNADPAKNQRDYFNNLVKTGCVFANQTYQRHGKGKLRLEVLADNIFDCNYMMFQNTNFGSKWFYAFIIDIEYINNQVSEITYTIDSLQTWFFDFEFGDCFIERRHTEYDAWSNNCPEIYTEEEVNQFDYKLPSDNSTYHTEYDMNDLTFCLLIAKHYVNASTGQEETAPTQIINGIPVTMGIVTLDLSDIPLGGDPAATIDQLMLPFQEESIVAAYLYPSILGNAANPGQPSENAEEEFTNPTPSSGSQSAFVGSVTVPINFTSLNGYTPNNKKMLGYPFNILEVTNNCGQVNTYRPELFSSILNNAGQVVFNVGGVAVGTPCVVTYPAGYRGRIADYDSSVTYNNFPMLPWAGDTYKAWLAQNKAGINAGNVQNLMNEIPSAIATGSVTAATDVGAMAAGVLGLSQPALAAAIAAGATVTHFAAHLIGNKGTKENMKNTPSRMYGQVLTEALNAGLGRIRFDFYNMQIRAEEAKIADNYFSKFGYACRRVLKPKLKARALWTFIKTKGCVLINDHLPATDAKAICDIMDNGITFWTTSATVGVYNMANNTPLGANAE